MTKIVITLSCDSAAEARDALAALAGASGVAKTTEAANDLIGALVAAPAAKPDTAPPPSLDEAIDALKAFGHERGAVALKGVLDQLGVRRATEIRPEQVNDLIIAMDGAAS